MPSSATESTSTAPADERPRTDRDKQRERDRARAGVETMASSNHVAGLWAVMILLWASFASPVSAQDAGRPPPGVIPDGAAPADPADPAAPTATCPPEPSTVPVDPATYFNGLWFQSAVSSDAARFAASDNQCVTANYTLTFPEPDSPSVLVNNCQYFKETKEVVCLPGTATRPDACDNSRFLVSFFPPVVGQYNIVDIYGDPAEGYSVAAVYSCEIIPGLPAPLRNLYIISRSRVLEVGGKKGMAALHDVVYKRLGDKGIDVASLGMVESPAQSVSECRYFFGDPERICRS